MYTAAGATGEATGAGGKHGGQIRGGHMTGGGHTVGAQHKQSDDIPQAMACFINTKVTV